MECKRQFMKRYEGGEGRRDWEQRELELHCLVNAIHFPRSKDSFVIISFRRISCALLLLAALAVTSGCSVRRLAAKQIITAPNLQRAVPTNQFARLWTNFFPNGSSNPLVSVSIPVGPPAAMLQATIFPPRDYHQKFASVVRTNQNGKRSFFLTALPETNDTFMARTEPATVILLHGYGMTKESMAPWALMLAQAGYRTITVDLRGHGQSTGPRIGFGKFEVSDLRQAFDYLLAQGLCDERVAVMGMSYGAAMALHWAAQDRRIDAAVAIAPYNRPDEAIERFAQMMKIPLPRKTVQAGIAGAATKLGLEWKDWSAEASMRRIKCPVLLIGGEKDPICPPEDIQALEGASEGALVKSIVVPEANHFVIGMWMGGLSDPIKAWLNTHLARKESRKQVANREKEKGRTTGPALSHRLHLRTSAATTWTE
jgi:pimeloyl-ACP methyl ester carboxylesterase